jgi:hypothetical protein
MYFTILEYFTFWPQPSDFNRFSATNSCQRRQLLGAIFSRFMPYTLYWRTLQMFSHRSQKFKFLFSGLFVLSTYSGLSTPGVVLVKFSCIHCVAALGVAPTVAGLCANDAASKNDEISDRSRPHRPARSPTRRRRAHRASSRQLTRLNKSAEDIAKPLSQTWPNYSTNSAMFFLPPLN